MSENQPTKTITARWLGERGIQKKGALLSFRVPPHGQKPLPEPLEISIPVRGVYHGLGDVVPGFDLRVARHDPEFVLREPPGFFLTSHASWTNPSSDSTGPSPRSKARVSSQKESDNALESIRSPFAAILQHTKRGKGTFSFNGNRQKL